VNVLAIALAPVSRKLLCDSSNSKFFKSFGKFFIWIANSLPPAGVNALYSKLIFKVYKLYGKFIIAFDKASTPTFFFNYYFKNF